MKNKRLDASIITLTPNPALDITIDIDSIHEHSTHRIDSAQRRLGGKGINVSTVVSEQGYSTTVLGILSEEDYRDSLRRNAFPAGNHENLSVAFTHTDTPLRSTFAVHDREKNMCNIFNERGGMHQPHVYEELYQQLKKILEEKPHSIVVLSGSMPINAPENFIEEIIKTVHEYGAQIIVDTSGANLIAACRAGADLVKPNSAELYEATGTQDIYAGVALLKEYGAKQVVLSAGTEGAYFFSDQQIVHAVLDRKIEGNPTGAGDALVAALATAYIDDMEPEESIRRAVAWSASAVCHIYAGTIGSEWKEFIRSVRITHIGKENV